MSQQQQSQQPDINELMAALDAALSGSAKQPDPGQVEFEDLLNSLDEALSEN